MLLICAHLKKPVVHSRADTTTQELANPFALKPAALLTRPQYRENSATPFAAMIALNAAFGNYFPLHHPVIRQIFNYLFLIKQRFYFHGGGVPAGVASRRVSSTL
jgi:hypothetical protein